MNRIDILLTSIILLYREREISKDPSVGSKDLVKNILSMGRKRKSLMLDSAIESPDEGLTGFITRMLEDPDTYDEKSLVLSELKVILKSSTIYYDTIKEQLNTEMSEGGAKRSIGAMKAKLHKYYQSVTALNVLNRLSFNLNNGKINKSIQEDIISVLPELETLCNKSSLKDPGLVNSLVLSSKDDIDGVLTKIKREKNETSILKTGWKGLNKAIQKGFRRGEMTMINALQHNYKSGFVQSILMQIARYNKPEMLDINKKPLLIYISLEDEIHNILKFMYKYIYFNENQRLPDNTEHDISLLSAQSMRSYVLDRLCSNGYEIAIVRGDPGQWTYHNITNLITQYEASGYEIHCCIIDYLAKLPTTGCDNTGPQGTGLRDLFNRMRNFFSS